MDEAAATRQAALNAVGDVEPEGLRERIENHVRAGSMVPGVLTILSVRAVTDGATGGATAGDDSLLDAVERRAAGVQLIYDGLRLTRAVARSNPWREPDAVAADGNGATAGDDADLAILAADVLVSRGFYLLARTAAAEEAVGVVRAFGRDQTDREAATTDRAADLDRRLEGDILELAVTTGVTAAGGRGDVAPGLADELAPEGPRFDAVEQFFDDARRDRVSRLAADVGRPLNRND